MAKKVKRGRVVDRDEVQAEDLTLVIDSEVDARAQEIASWAKDNPVPFAQVKADFEKAQITGQLYRPPQEGQMQVQTGFSVAYWHEVASSGAIVRRLVVACPAKVPPAPAVGILMRLFGFVNPMVNCKVWMNFIDKRRYAVNVLEPVTGDWESLKGMIQ